MGDKMVSLNVDSQLIKSVVEKKIATEIVDSLGNADELIEKMVAVALSVKVDRDGTRSKYSSDNKYDFIEAFTSQVIRNTAMETMKTWVKENSEKVKQAIIKEMMKPNTSRMIAKAFAESAVDSLEISWRPNITISFTPRKDL